MRPALSTRTQFTLLMSVLSTLFGTAVAGLRYGEQGDILSDLLKVAIVILLGSAVLAFMIWTVLQRGQQESPLRGLLAGALTATFIVPLPFFVSTFKNVFFDQLSGGSGLIQAVWDAFPAAVETGYLTFIYLTKASLAAVILGGMLGFTLTFLARKRAETSLTPH